MKKTTYIFLLTLSAVLLFSTCHTSQKLLSIRDMAKIYNPGQTYLHPSFSVFHTDTSSSNLIIKIYPNELLFNNANPELAYRASVRIKYKLMPFDDDITSANDTATYNYTINKEKVNERFYAQIPLNASLGKQYNLKITVSDLNRRASITNYITVDKRNKLSAQNFMLTDHKKNNPLSPPYTLGSKPFRIKYTCNAPDSIYISYYSFNPSAPEITNSFTEKIGKADSTLKLPFSERMPFALFDKGLYLFRFDTVDTEGLTVLNYGDYYPKIVHNEQMMPPLQYITNNFEFQNLKNRKNQKLALDNFWLSKAADIERGREMIRIYYNRVYFANHYFTSDREGWKTERGMVYVVYGPPEAIYKTAKSEEWLYFKGAKSEPNKFIFTKHDNPFSLNDYRLNRAESNTAAWRTAQQKWQQGTLFQVNAK